MSYLNPPYPNNFQELCAAMPIFYLDVFEMRAILRAQGRLLDGLCDSMEQLVDVNFILTADEATIRMWEKALEITYKGKLTLDQRKHVVIGYIIGLGHIGEREIRAIIRQYTPNHVDFDFMRGTIKITVDGIGSISGYTNLIETLCKRIPAHLTFSFVINIRLPPTTLHIGGAPGAITRIGIPAAADAPAFSAPLHVGGAFGAGQSFPVPEDPSPPSATTILRTGGVCTIISNLSLSKGE